MNDIYAVISIMGKDRIGMTDDLTSILIKRGCSINESKMAVLGGDFACIILISGPNAEINRLIEDAGEIGETINSNFQVKKTSPPQNLNKGTPYILESISLDTPGIVHSITELIRKQNINIEDLETEIKAAPMTGSPMFHMKIYFVIPEFVDITEFKEELSGIEDEMDLDIILKPGSF